jgi:hypothetical protein
MSRPAVVVSVLAHLAVLYAASLWYEPAPPPLETRFEWIGTLERPSEPVVTPTPEPVEPIATAPEPPAPKQRATVPPPPATVPPPAVEPEPAAPTEAPPAPAAGPSRLDLDSARRAAAAAVVEQRARDGVVLPSSIADEPPPRAKPEPRKPSIFDHQAHSGGGALSPGKARTAFGSRLSLWCNKVSGGGFGFFGIPVCASGRIEPPSGIFADSIPEYMNLKPECEETRPLAAALGETSPFPTVKCRLVPKDPDE